MRAAAAEKPQLPTDFEAVTWKRLEEAVHAVHEKRAVSSSFEELYRVRAGNAALGLAGRVAGLKATHLCAGCGGHVLAQAVRARVHKPQTGDLLPPASTLHHRLRLLSGVPVQECQVHIGRMVAQLATQGAMDLVVFLGQVCQSERSRLAARWTLLSITQL